MTIDKRISYQRGSIPDRNRGQIGSRTRSSAPTRSSPFSGNESRQQYSAKQTMTGAVKGGGPRGPDKQFTTSFVDPQRGRDSRDEFIRNVNQQSINQPSRDNFLTRAITGGVDFVKRNPLQLLLSAINPVFGAAMIGANFLNKPQFRERFTGYETQAEYDQARQDRINRNRINTLENTIQKKYLDRGISLDETDLDERLASLKEAMGIQDTAPNVMTARDENLRGIQTLDTGNQDFNRMFDVDKIANLINTGGVTNTGNFNALAFDNQDQTRSSNRYMVPFDGARTIIPNPNFSGEVDIPFGGTVLEDEFPSNRKPSFIEALDLPYYDEFFNIQGS